MTLAQQIQQILDSKTFMQRDIAQQSGISAGALSAYLKGTYAGNIDNIESALNNWLASQDKKQKVFVEAPHFIDIPTAKRVFGALDMAKLLPTMVTIYGASGVGKTKASQEYKKLNKNVWMITASPARATLSTILYELALELGINDAPRRKDRLSRMITKKLSGTQGLVIIDESDHLPYDALEEIRIIQEEADVGFALIGNDKVYTRIQGGVNQAHEYARLWSRIGNNCGIKHSTKADVKAVAQAWNLDIEDKELMNTLCDISTKAGGLRALTQYLRLAAIAAKGKETVISLDLILQAKAHMQGVN
ncbi:AAA family ATPase [Pasteurella multocida]|uniref:AAA family ATPase n=1 Tax=Pasteurella multocida TaxID=747 RepID=UPI00094B6B9F|nr:AAA family ATPase [Pasteurella multocida]